MNDHIVYVLKQQSSAGRWRSAEFEVPTIHHVREAVRAGFVAGEHRWAESVDGRFIFGLDAEGQKLEAPPALNLFAAKQAFANLEAEVDKQVTEDGIGGWYERKRALSAGLRALLETNLDTAARKYLEYRYDVESNTGD